MGISWTSHICVRLVLLACMPVFCRMSGTRSLWRRPCEMAPSRTAGDLFCRAAQAAQLSSMYVHIVHTSACVPRATYRIPEPTSLRTGWGGRRYFGELQPSTSVFWRLLQNDALPHTRCCFNGDAVGLKMLIDAGAKVSDCSTLAPRCCCPRAPSSWMQVDNAWLLPTVPTSSNAPLDNMRDVRCYPTAITYSVLL